MSDVVNLVLRMDQLSGSVRQRKRSAHLDLVQYTRSTSLFVVNVVVRVFTAGDGVANLLAQAPVVTFGHRIKIHKKLYGLGGVGLGVTQATVTKSLDRLLEFSSGRLGGIGLQLDRRVSGFREDSGRDTYSSSSFGGSVKSAGVGHVGLDVCRGDGRLEKGVEEMGG